VPGHAAPGPARRQWGDATATLKALALANARYWPTVAPVVRRELALWQAPAARIGDTGLRELAVGKLVDERFNAEVAATLATLAPRRERATATRAIVALELLFDYLDGRTELPSDDPIAGGQRLFAALTGAVEPAQATPGRAGACGAIERGDDGEYLRALSERAQQSLFSLPAAGRVAPAAHAAAERCAQAQTRLHAAATLGDEQLREWASEHGGTSGIGWREYIGGCASSVLAVHALIAAAGDPVTSAADALAIDAAYLAIGGVITMLDSLVDHSSDTARGETGFVRLFETREELALRLRALTWEALARARNAPHGEHHAMTLAGVVGYYTTHPGARERHARSVATAVRRELRPTIWPTLAVMRGWRAAKRAGALAKHSSKTRHRTESGTTRQRADIE
jgi:tetraprenyl-beta-curcumene synthase